MDQLPYFLTGLRLAYNDIQREFWVGFFANFLATLLAAFLLYIFIEQRIKNRQAHDEKIKLLRNLVNELITNYIISQRIIENGPISLTTDKFPVARFKFIHINNFLYGRPLEGKNKFYLNLSAITANMELTNSLIDLVFLSKDANAIVENKKAAIKSAPKLLAQINNLLLELSKINKRIKFTDEVKSPNKNDFKI